MFLFASVIVIYQYTALASTNSRAVPNDPASVSRWGFPSIVSNSPRQFSYSPDSAFSSRRQFLSPILYPSPITIDSATASGAVYFSQDRVLESNDMDEEILPGWSTETSQAGDMEEENLSLWLVSSAEAARESGIFMRPNHRLERREEPVSSLPKKRSLHIPEDAMEVEVSEGNDEKRIRRR